MSILIIGGKTGIGEAAFQEIAQRPDLAPATPILVPSQYSLDVGSQNSLRGFVDGHLQETNQEFTHVVFSAGVNHLDWLGETSEDDMEHIFNVNVLGFIRLLNVLAEYQIHPTRVVAVSSDAAVRPLRTSIAYCASKAALDQAVRVGARELGRAGWQVNAVAPGMVEGTPMTAYIDERVPEIRGWSKEHARSYEDSQSVLGRRIDKKEVARTISWLLFDAPDAINGAIIPVNGGR